MKDITDSPGYRSLLLFGIIIAVVVAVAACDSGKTSGNWTKRPINVDGDLSDWEKIPLTYLEQLEAEFAVCNDSDFMYVMFRFENQFRARMIRFGGVSIWVDPQGESEKVFGLRFNGAPDTDFQSPDRAPEDEERAARREERIQQFMDENPVRLVMIDKTEEVPERIVDIDGADGPAATCDIWRDYVVYEFRIPLVQTSEYDLSLNAPMGKDLAVGIELGGMRAMRQASGRGDRQRRPDSLRHDSVSGERREGRRPGGRQSREAWLATGLAAKERN
jgi:hypothetical protein